VTRPVSAGACAMQEWSTATSTLAGLGALEQFLWSCIKGLLAGVAFVCGALLLVRRRCDL
jgi:hypothetical protein